MSQQPPQGIPQMMPDQQQQDLAGNSYYPQENDLTGGLPINLDSLRDGPPGSKPFYPYSTLIRYAIKGSPNQKLLLEDIYYAIESRNSVRHNLSLNPCFEKVPRPLTDRGKGSYWTVNENVDPRTGVHRIRKKKSKNAKQGTGSDEADADYHPEAAYDDPHAQYVNTPMHPDDAGPSRQPVPFPPPFPPFDPNFPMIAAGMRFPPPLPGPLALSPDEGLEVDEHGNVNWRMAWLKEIGHLQQITAEQEKAGVDPEWYRMMLFRVRGALMPPPMNPEAVMHGMPPHGMPPPQPSPADVQQQQQQQQAQQQAQQQQQQQQQQ
ncbi:hypothetical protein BD779DRAFT_1607942 [Infundibulicybe gibba]|nr:hypothetical protein BD779DRAFT_1607942 [Infundibulicybe gibba]